MNHKVIIRQFQTICRLKNSTDICWMVFNGETVYFISSFPHGPEAVSINTGFRKLSDQFFHHTPPTAEETENAINFIEDELSRIRSRTAAVSGLYTGSPEILSILKSSDPGMVTESGTGRDQVEAFFNRFADSAFNSIGSGSDLPADRLSAAALLLLREILHHLQFERIYYYPVTD
jgi:exopolyphosphatase/pppGpp-phosphohydrolase